MFVGLVIGVAAWAIFFAGHIFAMRMAAAAVRPKIDQALFVGGLFIIVVGTALAMAASGNSVWTHGGWLLGALWGALAYTAIFVLYMPFFYTVATSLSVRTVVLLSRQPGGRLPVSALREEFASRRLVDQRLSVMATNGFIYRVDNVCRLTAKGRMFAIVFRSLKQLWRLGAGG